MIDEALLKQIIEGLLLAAGKPLTLDRISELIDEKEGLERDTITAALDEIAASCEGRGFELKKSLPGYRFQVRQNLSEWIGRLWEENLSAIPGPCSRRWQSLLTGSRLPVVISKKSGVWLSAPVSFVHCWKEIGSGWLDTGMPGRPVMYASTRQFLDYFNLESLHDLPALTEIRELEGLNKDLIEEEKPSGNVIEFPSELEDDEVIVPDEEELAAAAIGTRSMDEILGIESVESDDEDHDEDKREQGESLLKMKRMLAFLRKYI